MSIGGKFKYFVSKLFIKILIRFIGVARKYSDDTTKVKIDNMVSENIVKYIYLVAGK